MNRAGSNIWDLAGRLIAYEARRKKSSVKGFPPAFLAVERLRPHLTTLMGNAGFRALLSRALTLASVKVRWLRQVDVKADGSMAGVGALEQVAPGEITRGGVVLVVELLGLLVAFIGENLTLQMVGEVWPKLSLRDLDFYEGDENEKRK